MIPDLKIFRRDKDRKEYEVYFCKEPHPLQKQNFQTFSGMFLIYSSMLTHLFAEKYCVIPAC
jgi:hypothetical protein